MQYRIEANNLEQVYYIVVILAIHECRVFRMIDACMKRVRLPVSLISLIVQRATDRIVSSA